jgi:pSer/pThr/pTyr-binding forkhead associated (FHA) protein
VPTTIRITVLTGPHKNRRFCFRGPMHCTVGRAAECDIQLSGSQRDQTVSRRHCRLDIDPPCVQVEDLMSLNGTYHNGTKLEPAAGPIADESSRAAGSAGVVTVQDGDIITLGETSLQVHVVDCALGEAGGGAAVWPQGEMAKPDCPVPC